MDIAARVLLLPVLLAQAIYVRAHHIELPEPSGARKGETGKGPPLRLLIIGDSSAAGVGVSRQGDALLGQLVARLKGRVTVDYELIAKTGAKTADVLDWVKAMPDARYDVVVTALGVNDVTKAVPLRRWVRQQAALFDLLSARFACKRIIVSGLPPVGQFPLLPQPLRWVLGQRAVRFDRRIHALTAERPGCAALTFNMVLDASNMSVDGFHPGPVVYAAWAEAVLQEIARHPELLDGADAAP